jgi:tRNA pseudouridine55 synthase
MEKPVDKTFPTNHITEQMILETAKFFVGEQMQVPPIFSAVKIDGKRAYDYARQSQEVEIKAKPIFIKEFEITRISFPSCQAESRHPLTIEIDFRIVCSKGTYIRSIARDFGEKLQSGAYLSALRRTKIGDFLVNDAVIPSGVEESVSNGMSIRSLS